MDLHRLRFALLKIAIPVLLGTTWMFFAFIMDTRPAERSVGTMDRIARLPASLSSGRLPLATPPKVAEPVRMDVLRLPCWDKPATGDVPLTARWVRVVGRACGRGEATEVRNLTNGSVATVLPLDRGQATTDYIPLESGRNELLFTFKGEPGVKVENRLTIVR